MVNVTQGDSNEHCCHDGNGTVQYSTLHDDGLHFCWLYFNVAGYLRNEEEKIAYESLMDLCNEAGEYMNLENLSLYNMAILSDGEDETRCILDGGTYESELSGFSDEELDQFVSDVANRVDWTYLEENCTTMVKDMIHDAIHYELADRAASV